MTNPRLAKANSNYGGRGYRHPETGQVVPSITTVLKAGASPAIVQWSVDQTAAFAVANVEALLSRTEAQGWGFLRFYHRRNPLPLEKGLDIRNYHQGVLHDAAEMGTTMHEHVEADLNPLAKWPDVTNVADTHWQMVEVWDEYKSQHYIEAIETECTVWNAAAGYAGTFDLHAWIDGVEWLIDVKTSRGVWPDHQMQLAALSFAPTYFPDSKLIGEWKGSEWKGTWEEEEWSFGERYRKGEVKAGLLQIRPEDIDKDGRYMAPFVRMHELPVAKQELRYKQFLGLLQSVQADREVKDWEKVNGD